MTLAEHLAELRSRLVKAVAAVSLFGVVGFVFSDRILSFLIQPYCRVKKGGDCTLIMIDPLEGFATRIKIAAFTGVLLASPIVLWQIWRFVTPGLHPGEKRYAVPFISASIVLFVAGAAVALVTFPKALEFLVNVGGPNLVPLFSPARYLRLFVLVLVSFGVAFEFPVLLVFLQLARVLTSARLRRWRRGAILGIFVAAAIITPSQDPITLLFMAVPMYLFYEAAIVIGKLLKR
jgi:sec-independent protein translocase protein TatC